MAELARIPDGPGFDPDQLQKKAVEIKGFERCKNCRFIAPYGSYPKCVRHAPTNGTVPTTGEGAASFDQFSRTRPHWPGVDEWDYCGDFKPDFSRPEVVQILVDLRIDIRRYD
ncbi:MAG: hypothetical protein KDA68_14270 [Planctomycetaceae bacterium]|nr:hypothetical protein [Planctomycetaceae bacterium]